VACVALHCTPLGDAMQCNMQRRPCNGARAGWAGRRGRVTMRGEHGEGVGALPYMEFPKSNQGAIERKRFWLSDDGLALIAGFGGWGMTMEEIYNGQVGVSSTTWRSWLASSDGLREAISQTDEQVNCLVERALLRRALGYEVVEEDEELVEGEMRVVRRRR